jgi:glutaconyl-CoA/methylmalonyl-CoA decarboxylase subunit delta
MKRKIRLFPIMTILLAGVGGNESDGTAMALIALSIVVVVLVAMYFIFRLLSGIYSLDIRNKIIKQKGIEKEAALMSESISGEVNAAIVMTLFLYQSELHDVENTVLTIKKVSRTYSPWSSKIYGLRRSPR